VSWVPYFVSGELGSLFREVADNRVGNQNFDSDRGMHLLSIPTLEMALGFVQHSIQCVVQC